MHFLLATILLMLATLVAVQWVAYDSGFIARELIRLNSAEAVGISETAVHDYAEHTARYLRGAEKDPNMQFTIRGEERRFLNEREVLHMQDVQQLFTWARYLALSLFLVLLGLVWRAKCQGRLPAYLGLQARGSLLAILSGLILAALISQDFDQSFTLFHLLSFSNDLWLLDPATDLLINLLPETFFASAALHTALRAGTLLLLLAAFSYLLSRKNQKLFPVSSSWRS